MTVEIISCSIHTQVWDQAEIELATPGSAVVHATDCATGPSVLILDVTNEDFVTK